MLEEAAARTAALKDVNVPNNFNNNKSPSEQGQNNNFMYNLDKTLERNSRIKYFNGDYDQAISYNNQDPLYRKPYRQRSVSFLLKKKKKKKKIKRWLGLQYRFPYGSTGIPVFGQKFDAGILKLIPVLPFFPIFF